MKRFLIVASLLFVVGVAFADRIDVWSASSARVQEVTLRKLPDGGCAVQAFGTYTKQDGGVVGASSRIQELGPANRAACLDLMDNRARALFLADEGL